MLFFVGTLLSFRLDLLQRFLTLGDPATALSFFFSQPL